MVPIPILGLGIDYSIHLVMRYREERGDGESPESATRNTIVSVGGALGPGHRHHGQVAFLSNITSSMGAP